MGTWGSGNLANDYALDELGDRSAKFIKTMMARARKKASREADEWDHTTLFVEFEMLFALAERKLFTTGYPARAEVEALAQKFIVGWDAYIDELGATDDYKERRRATILETFERFAVLCDTFAT